MNNRDAIKINEFFEESHKKHILNETRKELLLKVASKIIETYQSNGSVTMNYICTHNSRRSQIGQVWTFFASQYFNLDIKPFSGGTEITAFHRNTVNTLKEVGFTFHVKEFSHENPVYQVSFEGTENYILGFSKKYDHPLNTTPYFAITTCDSADENCPFIPEAIDRFHLPYKDPKYADNTSEQGKAYLYTNEIIASEVFFIFNHVKSNL